MPEVGKTPADVVHTENKWRLLRYRPSPKGRVHRTPIVMVPSLINRHYVLDLMPGKSFIEWLVDQGHDVYCIDWGTPGPEDRFLDLDDFADRYLGRAVRVATRSSGTESAHLLGYCMGGIFTAIYAALRPERVASLVQLAAPVRFADDAVLNQWTRSPRFDVDALVRATGIVPCQILQGSFHLLRPTLTLSKAMHVLDRAWTDESLDGFLALETWGSDNVGLPGRFYQSYIHDLYREDRLMSGTLSIAGQRVRLGDITCPVLAVSFADDYIVPWQSAAAIVEAVGSEDTTHLHLPGGHVGAVVSQSAKKRLWPSLAGFWIEREPALASS
jgi:polyhydroxyalkanoate synthase